MLSINRNFVVLSLLVCSAYGTPVTILDTNVSTPPDSGRLVGQNLFLNETLAINFSVSAVTTLTSVQVLMFGQDFPGVTKGGTFTMRIFTDLGQQPGAILYTSTFQTGLN